MKKSINWAAIRHTNGEDWIDIASISTDNVDCEKRARQLDATIPVWAKDNPIKYFARIEIKLA